MLMAIVFAFVQIQKTFCEFLISNDILYVSLLGSAQSDSCSQSDPCVSIIDACGKGSYPKNLLVEKGTYEESEGFVLQGNIRVTGQLTSDCQVSKPHNSTFCLFVLQADKIQLVLEKLTIILTDHAPQHNYIRSESDYSTAIVISESVLTTLDNVVIRGQTIFVNNSNTTLELNNCTFFSIRCLDPVICTRTNGSINSLQITNSTFIGIIRTGNSSYNGSVYFLDTCTTFHLIDSSFNSCSSARSGVGGVVSLVKSAIVEKCSVANCSAGQFYGAMSFTSESMASVVLSNTSYFRCEQRGHGTFSAIHSVNLTMMNSSFIECYSYSSSLSVGNGGAVYIANHTNALIERCTFVRCWAGVLGGALWVDYNQNHIITNSVFLGNVAMVEDCDGSGGHDIYIVHNSEILLNQSCTDHAQGSKGGDGILRVVVADDEGTPSSLVEQEELPACGGDQQECARFRDNVVDDFCPVPCQLSPGTVSLCVLPSTTDMDPAYDPRRMGMCPLEDNKNTKNRKFVIIIVVVVVMTVIIVIIIIIIIVCIIIKKRRKYVEILD